MTTSQKEFKNGKLTSMLYVVGTTYTSNKNMPMKKLNEIDR